MVVDNVELVEDGSRLVVELSVAETAVPLVTSVEELAPVESGTEAVDVALEEPSVVVAPVDSGMEVDTLEPADALCEVVAVLSDVDWADPELADAEDALPYVDAELS
ncbi:hypothetical protein LTR08_003281 [Meristemomyces frigidus]|nr:hypothetical protein LTR08_003281 [Meristemomyces frigidus]